MAIEALAAMAAKEIGMVTAKEAAIQAGREIAQKMAAEASVQEASKELQVAMMERQTIQEGSRVGEMPETRGEGREMLKQRELDAADELRSKLDAEEPQPDVVSNPEKESHEVQNPTEMGTQAAEAKETTQEIVKPQEELSHTKTKWEDFLAKETTEGKFVYEGLQCGRDSKLLNSDLPKDSILEICNPTGGNNICIKTDGYGHVFDYFVDKVMRVDDTVRNKYQQLRCCWIKNGALGDQGGHILASEFGGPKEQFNLLPMNSAINRCGEWRRMEQIMEKYIREGKSISEYHVKSVFNGESGRPERFTVSMKIDGAPEYFQIKNPIKVV